MRLLQSSAKVCLDRVLDALEDIVLNQSLSAVTGIYSRVEDIVEEVGENVTIINSKHSECWPVMIYLRCSKSNRRGTGVDILEEIVAKCHCCVSFGHIYDRLK